MFSPTQSARPEDRRSADVRSRTVSRSELVRFAERFNISTKDIFSFPAERLDYEAALRMIRVGAKQLKDSGSLAVTAAEAIYESSLLAVQVLLGVSKPSSFDMFLLELSAFPTLFQSKCHQQGSRLTLVPPIPSPILHGYIAGNQLLNCVRQPLDFLKTFIQELFQLCRGGQSFAISAEYTESFKLFGELLEKLPFVGIPKERQLQHMRATINSDAAERAGALIWNAGEIQRTIKRAAEELKKLSSKLKIFGTQSSSKPGHASHVFDIDRGIAKIFREFDEVCKLLLRIVDFGVLAGVKESMNVRVARRYLRKHNILPSNDKKLKGIPPLRHDDNQIDEEFHRWWSSSAQLPAQDSGKLLIFESVQLACANSLDNDATARRGILRTELEKVPAIKREHYLDALVDEGVISHEQRRQAECWVLGEDLVKRGMIQLAREAFKPLLLPKDKRGQLILSGAEALPIDELQRRASSLIEFAEALMDTKVIGESDLCRLLLANPKVLQADPSELTEVALQLLDIDSRLIGLDASSGMEEVANDRLAILNDCTAVSLSEQLAAVNSELITVIGQSSQPQIAEEHPIADLKALAPETAADVHEPALAQPGSIEFEYQDILANLESDPICRRWNARELVAVIAGFTKKSQIWMGESYFRTESLRKNVNALIGYQVDDLIGILRFLAREGVVGHLGYKGGTTVASLNPSLSDIENEALKRATQFGRKMINPEHKAAIVEQIKRHR